MADRFIDPSALTNGSGTSEADPRNTWVGLTFVAGNRYLQKRGTTFTTASGSGGRIIPTVTGTLANPIYIGAYGDTSLPPPKIVSNADTCFVLSGRSYITIEDFDIMGGWAVGGGSSAASGDMNNNTIRRVRVFNSNSYGISFQTGLNGTSVTGLLIEDCYVNGAANHGIILIGDFSSAKIKNNKIKNVAQTVAGHGISIIPHRVTTTQTWANTAGNVYSTTVAAQTYASPVADIYGVRYTNGSVTLARAAVASSPNLNEYGYSGTTLYINIGGVPSGTTVLAYTNISAIVSDNTIENVYDFDGNEGHGIQFDDLSSNCIAKRNKILNCAGLGLQINMGRSNTLTSNFVYNCLKGGAFIGTNGAVLNSAYNNTFYGLNNTQGLGLGSNSTGKNNIIYGYTTAISGTSGSTENYNSLYNYTTARTGGLATGANSIITNPLLNNFTIRSTSPCYRTGSFISSYVDLSRNAFNNPPSIGAYEYTPVRADAGIRGVR